jgi:uncharacterized protein (UPF0218 family)
MLVLPESLRDEVRKPFGAVLTGKKLERAIKKAARPIISVGDRCAHDLIASGNAPDMMIFDFKIKRVEIPAEMKKALAPHAKNAFVVLSGAGHISDSLDEAVGRMLSEGKGAIFVAGEDDLSSLLVMARAESGTLVYGQPDSGAVLVPLGGKKIKEKAQGFLDKMERV